VTRLPGVLTLIKDEQILVARPPDCQSVNHAIAATPPPFGPLSSLLSTDPA
jgi:hypothetical protein